MTHLRKLRLVEFLLVGVSLGVLEDIITIAVATDATINLNIMWVVLAAAIPFAVISELVVDHPRFWKLIWPQRRKK